ncbi:MAG: hypothetical protein JWR69_3219 [Pedosphaera sp.]|nr:hypothetical protein [Pedosphaera sp.]
MKGLIAILIWLIVVSLSAQPVAPFPPAPGPLGSLPTNGLPLPGETRALIQQLQSDIEQLHPLLALANGGSGIPESAPIGYPFNPFYPGVPPHPVPNAGQLLATNLGQNFGVNYGQDFSGLTSVTPPGVTPMPPPKANSPFLPFPFTSPAPPPPTATPAPNAPLGTNELILLNNLELALQGVQADIQELRLRLERLAPGERATANGSGSAALNNPGASGLIASPSGPFGQSLRNGFGAPLSNQFATPLSNQFATPLTNGNGHLR